MNAETPTWHGRAILHVDMDAFFAAVEQLDDPALRGKPVIVGGSPEGRGVVSTCSYEARVFGVRSAMPSARAAQLCPQAIWVRGNFDRYRDISRKVRDIFGDITPHVQPVSIDEAYLDVTPSRASYRDPVDVAREIQARVDDLGVSCSIGVATTKTVAKIASDHDKPHGITVVRPGEEAAFLAPLPVEALPGIGPKSAARLRGMGIRTLGELAALDAEDARSLFGLHGAGLVARAAGIDDRPVHHSEPAKSVSNERTFAKDIRDSDSVRGAIDALAQRVSQRLRAKGIAGRTVTLKIRYADFTTRTVQRTVEVATDSDRVIVAVVRELLATAWSEGVGVRLLGVGVSGFEPVGEQLDLFAEDERVQDPRDAMLLDSLDAVRERFGDEAIRRGVPRTAPGHAGETNGST